ncbi:MAG: amidohydrolase, partial [Deltaproteobacteria bacterium]|nr:amidohydrolase [Deltaproteobacteria bacterium]
IEHNGVTLNSAPREFVDIEKILQEQDRAGVNVIALSPWSSLFNYDQPVQDARKNCHAYNLAIANGVRDYPARLAGLGCVPLQDARAAADETRALITDLNLRGVEIGSNVNGTYLGDEKFFPFWETVAELDAFVFIHPVPGLGGALMKEYELGNLYGNPAETGLTTASLIFNGVLERFPNLKILLAHGGGALPYLIGRFDHGWNARPAAKKSRIPRAPSTYLKQFFFDTILFSADALRYLVQLVGAEHVVVGTDYPFDMGYENPRAIVDALGLSRAESEMILHQNAARLLKIN